MSTISIIGAGGMAVAIAGRTAKAGHTVEERLGPKDAIFNPAGRVHYFRNDGVADAEFMLLVGTARAEDVRFQAA